MNEQNTQTMSSKAQDMRDRDITLGRLSSKLLKDMREDDECLKIINALYEVVSK